MSAKFCFADAVESMMEFRRSVGLSDRTTKSVAAMFGEYCTENSITIPLLTREVAEGWIRWESGHGRRGLPHKATFLRLLARFINATGGSAYELPVACTPKGNGFSPHIFTDDELSMLFEEIDRYEGSGRIVPHGTYSILFRTIYTCGLRPGEGCRILISDVDLASGRMFIRGAKRHKERIVVASEDMRKLLARFVSVRGSSSSPYLFPRTDGRIIGPGLANDVFRRCWAMACRKVGVTNPVRVRVYDLRHRFASVVLQRWQEEGRNVQAMIPRLRSYMGHEHIESTLYYVHLLPQRLSSCAGVDWDGLERLIPEVADENAR